MSDYINRQDVLDIIDKEMMRTITFAEHETQANIEDSVRELPTLNETEIIRKPFERVVEQLNGLMPIQFNGFGKTLITVEDVIKILKEECGINE